MLPGASACSLSVSLTPCNLLQSLFQCSTSNISPSARPHSSLYINYIGAQALGYIKVKWTPYRPGAAQRMGRGIALLFHDRGTGRGWVVSSTLRPHLTPGKDPVPILQEAGWAPGPVWTGGKSRPHRDSISDRPARSSVAIPTELPGPTSDIYFL